MEASVGMVMMAAALGTAVSLGAAAWLGLGRLSRLLEPMVSLSTGVLLATALLHLLPEAFERAAEPSFVFAWLLSGILLFFMLEKLSLIRHNHHHEHDGHQHHKGYDAEHAGRGGLLIVLGNGMHNFADGLLIASAFLVDPRLGWMTTLSVALHQLPQQAGDFLVLLNAGLGRRRAFLLMSVTGVMALAGAALGLLLLDDMNRVLPYALVLAAASFLYIAVADLIPQMQRRLQWRQALQQFLLLGVGVAAIAVLARYLHAYG
ncbi:MAG: ZIP family metal transporter [Burkholderiaceae bacterium]